MKFNIETIDKKQSVLIVSKKHYSLVKLLKEELIKYNAEIFFSPEIPEKLDQFDYCFFINFDILKKTLSSNYKKITLIFLNQPKIAEKVIKRGLKNVKVVSVLGETIKEKDLENIFWFSFSKTTEHYLRLTLPIFSKSEIRATDSKFLRMKNFFSKKLLIMFFVLCFLFFHFAFIFPLIVSYIYLYQTSITLKNESFNKIEKTLETSASFLTLTKKLYRPARPMFLFFSLALIPDNAIDINEKAQDVLKQSTLISNNAQEILKLILKKEKTPQEKTVLLVRIKKINAQVKDLEENLRLLSQKLPSQPAVIQQIKQSSFEAEEMIVGVKKLLSYLEKILAKDGQSKYLFLFANNRELRPGGGFIGSFGVLTVKDLTVEELKIYDTYDADGQLLAHIEPPSPIKNYLQQFHWYLRDSAFSPDFLENYAQAKIFLEKEMGFKDFAGGILITTTAIENLLQAFGDIYLPDLNETVNHKNFYIKTQIQAEHDFFPGSIQKKSFLSSLTRAILIDLENAPISKIIKELKNSLDKKQAVVYFDDPEIQEVVENLYWSGRVINAQCSNKIGNCTIDYLFPYDANLGANKANFFISHQTNLRIILEEDGDIRHILTLKFKNDSSSDTFPGGTYRNYFQLLLPKEARIKTVTKNDTLVEKFDEIQDQFKKIGFLFDVLPKNTTEVKIDYLLEGKVKKGRNIYQLIVQKQIGSFDNDFNLEMSLPKNIYLINQNFSPLVKDNLIIYNTILSSDKIFFVELIKD